MSISTNTRSAREYTEDEIKDIFKKYASKKGLSIDHHGLVKLIKEISLPAKNIHDFEPALKKSKGSLKFNSFIKILRKQCGVTRVEADPVQLTKAFDRLDTNRDGFIDLQEMKEGAKAMHLKPEDVPVMMKAADTDGDGRVDYQEFLKVIGYDGVQKRAHTPKSRSKKR